MPLVSPYNFGLDEEYLFSIPPLFYFFFKTIEGILFPPQPFTPRLASNSDRLRPAFIDTCSPTEPQEISISNDHRRTIDGWHAVIGCILIILLCSVLRFSEDKWNMSSRKGSWSYRLDWMKEVNYPPETRNLAPIMVPSHQDYRFTQRREAIRVLFMVMVTTCVCPITEYFLCTRAGISERLHNIVQGNTAGEAYAMLVNGLLLVYLIFRYGILPWFVTAVASTSIVLTMLPLPGDAENAMSVWDRWIERWIIAHQLENAAAEARYMAAMKDLDPGPQNMPTDFGLLDSHVPELTVDVSWRNKYKGFSSTEYFAGLNGERSGPLIVTGRGRWEVTMVTLYG
ncbi:hypothetical protein QR685DRAFT_526115 [Neurospora intermedia]|uniref:Uncharacterized protein n=1 Tax=Neurospora intermedia TaxID=5142 RepID=A0ABR3D9C1_NEUIN